tara:strand:- start:145 stop:429 length:285 start_codon:yes stop_codon:yes gene_type:complete
MYLPKIKSDTPKPNPGLSIEKSHVNKIAKITCFAPRKQQTARRKYEIGKVVSEATLNMQAATTKAQNITSFLFKTIADLSTFTIEFTTSKIINY